MLFKDINCGFRSRKPDLQYAATYEQTACVCRNNGIVGRAIYHLDKSAESNEITCRLAAQSGGTEYPVLRLLPPAYPDEALTRTQMEQAITQYRALFRIHPKTHAAPLHAWMYGWMLDVLCETKTPLLVSLQELNLQDAAYVKERYPSLRLIITNTDQWLNRQYLRFAQYFDEVYFDTCNIIEYHGLENLVSILGAERFLFGTNMPDKEPYDQVFQLLFCGLSQEQKEHIAFRNFERLVEVRGV